MKSTVSVCALALALLSTNAAHAERPFYKKQNFKLDAETGCFEYTGNAIEFVGRFKAASFVYIAMHTLDGSGKPVPSAYEQRVPLIDVPELRSEGSRAWYGPVPATKAYSITFMPSSTHGSVGRVQICGRTYGPMSQGVPEPFTAEEQNRMSKAASEGMMTDPYSLSLLDEPKALLEEPKTGAVDPDVNPEPTDMCGMPVREVVIQAGDGSDASPLQPRVAGSVRHYANLYESPFELYALCTPSDTGQAPKLVRMPNNTKDCYFAGGRLECSYLAKDEMVPAE